MDIDIELILLKATGNELEYIKGVLPSNYYVIDKSNKNWGLVI